MSTFQKSSNYAEFSREPLGHFFRFVSEDDCVMIVHFDNIFLLRIRSVSISCLVFSEVEMSEAELMSSICCGKKYRVALFRDVVNSKQLRQFLFEGSLNCALIKPGYISCKAQLFSAVESALLKQLSNSMKTKNVNTEVIFNLHPDHQISEALKTISIDDGSKQILAVTIDDEGGEKIAALREKLQGTSVFVGDEWAQVCDAKAVQSLYKMSDNEKLESNPFLTCSYVAVSQLSQRT